MAKTALTQLEEQIEVIRQGAYAAGYAAAMRAIREFSAKPLSASAPRRGRAVKLTFPVATKEPARRGRRSAALARPARGSGRSQRGTNARVISEILRAAGADFVRPAVIRTELQSQKNTSIAFASIRHALGQLEARGEVERSADGKSWRYVGAGS